MIIRVISIPPYLTNKGEHTVLCKININVYIKISEIIKTFLNCVCVSVCVSVCVCFRTGLNRIYTLSFLWYPTLALVVAVVVGILVSAVSGKPLPAG